MAQIFFQKSDFQLLKHLGFPTTRVTQGFSAVMDVFSKVGKILRYWFYLRVACILFYISIFASILDEAKKRWMDHRGWTLKGP